MKKSQSEINKKYLNRYVIFGSVSIGVFLCVLSAAHIGFSLPISDGE